MKYFLIFWLILLTAVFQTTIWGFNFLLLLVLAFSLTLEESWSLFFAFLAGLVLDLFSGSSLGFSSLGFLLASFLLLLSSERFSFQNPFNCFVFTFVFYFLFSLISKKPLNFWEGVFLGILFLGLRFLVPFLLKRENQEILKLEV